MIAGLKGTVVDIGLNHLVIDVGGVWYLVTCSTQTVVSAKLNQEVTLFIETIIREDAISLYGFTTKTQQEWFQLLTTKVQGVGAKSAIALLSTLSLGELTDAIHNEDTKAITKAPGIGPKVAQRVISELRGKTPDAELETDTVGTTSTLAKEAAKSLASLGFDKNKADKAIRAASQELGENADITTIIRLAIRHAN